MSPRYPALPGLIRLFSVSGLLAVSGCYNPYMHRQPPYGQPMYGQPQMMSPTAPGTLVIPDSNAPPYDPASPGSTYEDATDDWQRSPDYDDGQFYRRDDTEGGVPQPREPGNSAPFDNDLGSGVQRDSGHRFRQPLNKALAAGNRPADVPRAASRHAGSLA